MRPTITRPDDSWAAERTPGFPPHLYDVFEQYHTNRFAELPPRSILLALQTVDGQPFVELTLYDEGIVIFHSQEEGGYERIKLALRNMRQIRIYPDGRFVKSVDSSGRSEYPIYTTPTLPNPVCLLPNSRAMNAPVMEARSDIAHVTAAYFASLGIQTYPQDLVTAAYQISRLPYFKTEIPQE